MQNMVLSEPFLWGSQALNYLALVTIEKNHWAKTKGKKNTRTRSLFNSAQLLCKYSSDRLRFARCRIAAKYKPLSGHRQLPLQSPGYRVRFQLSWGHGYQWRSQIINLKRGIVRKHHAMAYVANRSFLWQLENCHERDHFENFIIYSMMFYSW